MNAKAGWLLLGGLAIFLLGFGLTFFYLTAGNTTAACPFCGSGLMNLPIVTGWPRMLLGWLVPAGLLILLAGGAGWFLRGRFPSVSPAS
jgi:hypothetical protein